MKKFTLASIMALLLIIPFFGTASAAYPTKPIQILYPFGVGGAGDLTVRIVANTLQEELGQPIVIVNRPGAGGIVGTTMALTSKNDGYTLLAGRVANMTIIPTLNETIKYEWDDFVFLGLLDLNPLVFVVHKDSPYKTMQDLANALKANPGKLTFSTGGVLNIQELTVYMLLHAIGLPKSGAISVPFPSDAASKNALLGGHIQFGALNIPAAYDQLGEGGNLRPLAVTTPQRLAKYPDIPTIREAGFPDLENMLSWNALFGIKGMPQEAIDKWVAALATLMTNEAWVEKTEKMSAIPYVLSPADTKEFLRKQVEKFEKLGKALDLVIQ